MAKTNRVKNGWGTGKLSTPQALQALGISRGTLHNWMKEGKIKPIPGIFNPSLKVQPALFFTEESVKALMGPEQLEALEQELGPRQPEYIQPPLSQNSAFVAA